MRLLNTRTLLVEQFPDERDLIYAILSHRWGEDEVVLSDIENGSASMKSGYEKLQRSCDKAREDGYDYLWIDTCCIDKTSSAELTEAINSMYRWYENSDTCYAFLFDVTVNNVRERTRGSFHKSVWFTRGWTLQELIAPRTVEFYNCDWKKLGTKHDLSKVLSEITGIDLRVLSGETHIYQFSVAQRMSWASKRETTRIEDVAYSLMGLFDINMPMIYGEGKKAFRRLQEEIMKSHDDWTLFAWDMLGDGYRGPFAESSAEFAKCGNIIAAAEEWQSEPPLLSSKGVSIKVFMIPWTLDVYLVPLDCWDSGRHESSLETARIGIFLCLLPHQQRYARIRVDGSHKRTFPKEWKSSSKFRQGFWVESRDSSSLPLERLYGFWIRTPPPQLHFRSPNQDLGITSEASSEYLNLYNTLERKEFSTTNGTHSEYLNPQDNRFDFTNGAKNTIFRLNDMYGVVPKLELSFDDDFQVLLKADVRILGTTVIGQVAEVIPRVLGSSFSFLEMSFSLYQQVIEGCLMWVVDITKSRKRYQHEHDTYHRGLGKVKSCAICPGSISGLKFKCIDCKFPRVECCYECTVVHNQKKGHKFKSKLKYCNQKCPVCDSNAEKVDLASKLGILGRES